MKTVCAWLAVMLLVFGACANDAEDENGQGADAPATTADASLEDSEAAEVTARNISFNPESITISVGTTVEWTNEDQVAHTVTAGKPGERGDAFDEQLPPGGTASVTFDEAGTFSYFCTIHPSMTAEVVVN